jgi:thiosulfate/3-mercaptopyruvate sulfurtransferase
MPPQFSRRHLLFAAITGVTATTSLEGLASPAEIPKSAMLQPDELLQILEAGNEKPLILQIGVRFLYAQAHIPGAEYVGATESAEGLAALRQRVAKLSKKTSIVLYCGCCPWIRCPNIRPAFKELRASGFVHVKALYIADNFAADWTDKGYPVSRDS